MPLVEKEKIEISDHVLEIRHVESGIFLDVRGFLADYISNERFLPHWKISDNKVDFFDEPQKIGQQGAFISYNNIGYIAFNPKTKNFFKERALSFFKLIQKNTRYEIPQLTRFGARYKYFFPSEKDFEEILDLTYKNLFTNIVTDILGCRKTDLGFHFVFKDGQFDARIIGGPMHKEEAKTIFPFKSENFDDAGFLIDIDYYRIESLKTDLVSKLLYDADNLILEKLDKFKRIFEF